jgi:heme-degrading monooxygenase HmoA
MEMGATASGVPVDGIVSDPPGVIQSARLKLSPSNLEVHMVARTSTWAGSSEALDKWAEHVKAKVSGFIAGLPGNAGGAFFIDRDAGKALTLTLWDSEEAAAATDKFAEQSRASTVEATGVELVERGAYEVVMRF